MKVTIEENEKSIVLDGKAIAEAVSKASTRPVYSLGLQVEQKKESPIDKLKVKLDVKPKEDFEIPASDEGGEAFDGHGVGNSMERGKRIYWNKTFSDACEEILDILVQHKICMWDLNMILEFSNNILSGHSGKIYEGRDTSHYVSETCKEIVYTVLKHKIAPDDAKTVFKYVYHLARQNSPVVAKFPG